MSNKGVLQKLLEITKNQHKIITKLAQALPDAEGAKFAAVLKSLLLRKVPGINITELKVENFATKHPTLTMTADKVPANLKGFLMDQFLMNEKIPAALLVNGIDIKS